MSNQVTFNLKEFNVNPSSNVQIVLTPSTASFPRAEGDDLIKLGRAISKSSADGVAVFNNVLSGYYDINIIDPYVNTRFVILVPTGSTDPLNANTLIVDEVTNDLSRSFILCNTASVALSVQPNSTQQITASWSGNAISASYSSTAKSSSYACSASFSNNAEQKLPLTGGTLSGDLIVAGHNLYVTGGFVQAGYVLSQYEDNSANTAPVSVEINHTTTTGTPAAGNGVSVDLTMNSDTTARTVGTRLSSTWLTASHAGRTSKYSVSLLNSGSFGEVFNVNPRLATFTMPVSSSAFTGSTFGTSSNSVTASFAVTASHGVTALTASHGLTALSASFALASNTTISASSVPNMQDRIYTTRVLTTAIGEAKDIGTWASNFGSHNLLVGTTMLASGASLAKTYIVNGAFGVTNAFSNFNSGSWLTVQPVTSTGKYSSTSEDFSLEGMMNGLTMSLRLVRLTGSTVATVHVDVVNLGHPNVVFTPLATTTTVTASTSVWPAAFNKMEGWIQSCSGSLNVSQSINALAVTSSLFGTASFGVTASFAVTSSQVKLIQSASTGPSTQTTASGWMPINVGGSLRYIALYN